MSDLSNVLPEPPDGTMVVLLDNDLNPFLTARNDAEGNGAWRWFAETSWLPNGPMTWSAITENCLFAHVIPSAPTAMVPRQGDHTT